MSADSNNLSETTPKQADPESIADFLKENPDFFVGRDELIEVLTIPHESGQAISLIQKQVSVLRSRNEQQEKQIRNLIENANSNDALFEKTRMFILSLLKAETLEQLSEIVNQELACHFETVENHLVLIGEHERLNTELTTYSYSTAQEELGELFARKRTFCGKLENKPKNFFFSDSPAQIASAAIVPIHLHQGKPEESTLLPVLVTGSADPDYFHSGQDTLFLDFMGEVIAGLISNFLKR